MLDNVPFESLTALVRTHNELLRANMTGPLGISIGTDSALGQDVIVETVGKDVGVPVGASVPSSLGSVSAVVGERVGVGLVLTFDICKSSSEGGRER
jgi:hypothetical protein